MAFFKKAEDLNNRLFMPERGVANASNGADGVEEFGWDEKNVDVIEDGNITSEARYNENSGSIKRRKVSAEGLMATYNSPPEDAGEGMTKAQPADVAARVKSGRRRTAGPFVDDSESETEDVDIPIKRRGMDTVRTLYPGSASSEPTEELMASDSLETDLSITCGAPPLLKSETTLQYGGDDFDEFEGIDDEEFPEGEEYDERRWMMEQERLEMAEAGFDGYNGDEDAPEMFPGVILDSSITSKPDKSTTTCPLCNACLDGLSEQEALVHVNACLDGNPIPLSSPKQPEKAGVSISHSNNSKMFKKPPRPAKAGQANPFQLGETWNTGTKSAFSALMANHAEDAAWASAAASDKAARGKPSYQRTCPFYKILPGFYIAVDAFRYGAIKGQTAYFLSHFHSDHYVGLTASWSHGPIYCSRVTANLVRQQLRVDPRWVVDLEFEKKTEVPDTDGVHVTMIPANHCPGSSLFLFEKAIAKGKNPRLQRVLHCGDFRACRAHAEHPLLRPEVLDSVSGKNRQQKLDVCYLDTTYLNPKYAFPPQQQVIQACADMCASLNKVRADESDGWEQMKKDRAGKGMAQWVRKESDATHEESNSTNEEYDAMEPTSPSNSKDRGRLLVIVGTYSIGKERICVGIAKALQCKIYAPPNKQRICHALEDPELNALLTNDPREAQVHMTPLFEIRAETLEDYLRDYRDTFSRAVGFRPSGWNYRPPNSRFTENPTVQTVLHSSSWKSTFSMKDLTPQRGSTSRASCFGVPYSEHSSFRELTMFCCTLRIDKIIPTVNVGSAKSREKMKAWCEKWAAEKKKNGLFKLDENGSGW
jgi:DNA cross-link repair 1A protein